MRGTRCPHQASLLSKNILNQITTELQGGLAVIKLDLKLDSFYNFVVGGGDDGDWDDEAKHVDVGDV